MYPRVEKSWEFSRQENIPEQISAFLRNFLGQDFLHGSISFLLTREISGQISEDRCFDSRFGAVHRVDDDEAGERGAIVSRLAVQAIQGWFTGTQSIAISSDGRGGRKQPDRDSETPYVRARDSPRTLRPSPVSFPPRGLAKRGNASEASGRRRVPARGGGRFPGK